MKPLRVLLHGVEKVGKTSTAAGAPSPIFICPEDGIPRALGEVPHYPPPEGGWTWQDVIDAVRALATGEHEFKTLVIDTVDWIEPLLWRDVCGRSDAASIEDVGGGYGKGYTAALDGWRSLLAELERLRARGMHVILLAHSWIRPFKDPVGEGYDRYELKINNKAAGLLKEWCDAVLFAQHEDITTKDKRTKRTRGVSTGARVMFTVHHAAYDAGNRFNLPEMLPLDWAEFMAAVEAPGLAVAATRKAIEESAAALPAELAEKARAALGRAGDDPTKLAQLNSWVNTNLAAGEKENV